MSQGNDNLRYVGKIKNVQRTNSSTGEQFNKSLVFVDNPHPAAADGKPNPYHKGSLLWYDIATRKYYKIKQLDLAGVSDNDKERGFTNSLRIDLGSQYHVEDV